MNSAIELPVYFSANTTTAATTSASGGGILDLNNLMSIDHQFISFYDESNLVINNHKNETFLIQDKQEQVNHSPILIDNNFYNNFNIDFDETFLCNIDKLLDENSVEDLLSPNPPTIVNDSSESFHSDSLSSPPPSSMFDSYFMYGSDSGEGENSLADTDIVSIDRKTSMKKVKTGRVSKKESNRAAALRYREKKQREREQLFIECEMYAKKNAEMRKKIDDTMTEISFIKSLLVEALVARKSS